jgi:hypothetical protein
MQQMFKMDTVSFLANEIKKISPEMLQNVRGTCYYRFGIWQERNGAHFEHLLH